MFSLWLMHTSPVSNASWLNALLLSSVLTIEFPKSNQDYHKPFHMFTGYENGFNIRQECFSLVWCFKSMMITMAATNRFLDPNAKSYLSAPIPFNTPDKIIEMAATKYKMYPLWKHWFSRQFHWPLLEADFIDTAIQTRSGIESRLHYRKAGFFSHLIGSSMS